VVPTGITFLAGHPLAVTVVNYVVYPLFLAAFPALIAVAILKYRLYDIDLILNKTLVYAPLAALITPPISRHEGCCYYPRPGMVMSCDEGIAQSRFADPGKHGRAGDWPPRRRGRRRGRGRAAWIDGSSVVTQSR
jgi:hypothetical protein